MSYLAQNEDIFSQIAVVFGLPKYYNRNNVEQIGIISI